MTSLSVGLCAYNEAATLPAALAALQAQDRPADEVILLDDASTDGTGAVLETYQAGPGRGGRVRLVRLAPGPHGPPVAYNTAAECADADWLFLTAANDVVQPGAFAAWADAAARWPQAALMVGDTAGERLRWAATPTWLSAAAVAERLAGGGQIHGAGVFIRRAIWQREGGYDPTLEWLADWWLYHRLALTAGCVYLPQPIAALGYTRGQYSNGYVQPARMAAVAVRLATELRQPQYAAVRERLWPLPLLNYAHVGGGQVRAFVEAE